MNILKKLRYPLIWISESIIKYLIRKLIFKNLAKNDFKNLLSYTLDLLPHETFINTIKLLINTFKAKPVELTNIKIIDEVMTHTIPIEQRTDVIKKAKYLFIFLILGNIFKRSLFLVKNIILLPFKLGVYSFLASLFGIRPDYFLSFFEIFKFNLPSWTYNKLLELHISWLSWWKNTLNVGSISTDFNDKLSLPKPNTETISISKPDPDTYLYLTKTQWFYLTISIAGLLAAYLGYTWGIPFTKSFDWESKSDDGDDTDGGDILIDRGRERSKTWTESIKESTINIINKLNPFSWGTVTTTIEPEKNILDLNDHEKYLYFKEIEKRETAEYQASLKRERKTSDWFRHIDNEPLEANKDTIDENKKSSWLSWFWKSHDEIQIERLEKLENIENIDIKKAQLERLGHLTDPERDELRKNYIESKDSSPSSSDSHITREREKYFKKPNISIQGEDEIWTKDVSNKE